MSPWIWAFLIITLAVLVEWWAIQRSHDQTPTAKGPTRWYIFLFVFGIALLVLNLRIQQGSVDATNSLSRFMGPLFLAGLALVSLSIFRSQALPVINRKNSSKTRQAIPLSGNPTSGLTRKYTGMLLFSLLLVVAAIITAGSEDLTRLPAFVPPGLWLAGIILSFAAGWDRTTWVRPNRKTTLIAGSLFLLALSARLIYLGQIPNPMYGDEGSFSFSAVRFITGESNNLFNTSWFRFPSLYFFIQSLPIRLFGNTVLAARLWSAFVGALTVVATFVLGRELFSRRIGLIAAVLLAANPLHMEFSRIALNNIWDALSFTTVLGTLWYAWTHNKRNAFLLAGFFFGMSQYFYVTGRLLLVLVPLWLVILAYRQGTEWRQKMPHLLSGTAVALATALPIFWYYLTHLDEYFQAVERVSLWTSSPETAFVQAFGSISKGVLGYTHVPLKEFFDAGIPMLRLWPALFFLLGIVFLLKNRLPLPFLLLATWLLALSIVAGLSANSPAAQRMIAAAPAANLIAAYGLGATADFTQTLWPRIKRVLIVLLIIPTLWMATDDLRFYFFEHTPQWDNGLTSEVSFRLAMHTRDSSAGAQVILFVFPDMAYSDLLALRYLAPQVEVISMEDTWGSPYNPEVDGEHLLFVFTAEHEDSLKSVQQDYPQGTLLHETYRKNETVYWLYEVGAPSQQN